MAGVAPNRRPVNMVFQQLALFPMMSVGENVAFGLARRGVARAERHPQGRGHARARRSGRRGRQARRRALRRPAPARRHRAQPGARADAAAARRAARRPRPEAARAHEDRAQAAAVRLWHDLRLYHPRPVRGPGAVRSRRRHEPRSLRAAGHAAGLYYPPATPFVAAFVGANNRIIGQASGRRRRARRNSPRPTAGSIRARGAAPSATGARSRPSCGRRRPPSGAAPAELPPAASAVHAGEVESLLFDGANSAVLLQEESTRLEFRIALPQTGPLRGPEGGRTGRVQFRSRCGPCVLRRAPARLTMLEAAANYGLAPPADAGPAAGAGAALACSR